MNLNKIIVTGRKLPVFFLSVFCAALTMYCVCGDAFLPQLFAQVKQFSAIPEDGDDLPVPADKLFPDTVKGFVAIQDLKLLGEQWKKTQIGLLMQDPIMKPFLEDFNKQLEKRMASRIGLTLDGIEELPSGEVAFGMVAIPEKIPGYVFTMDTADRRKQVADYIDRLTKKFLAIGVKRSVDKYKGDEIIVFTFPNLIQEANKNEKGDIDKNNKKNNDDIDNKTTTTNRQTSRQRTTTRSRNTRETEKNIKNDNNENKPVAAKTNNPDPEQQNAYYLLKGDYLVISNQLHLIYLFADRISEGHAVKNSLADVKEYQGVISRCLSGVKEDSFPLIHWYIEPLNYGESMRVLLRRSDTDKRKGKKSIFASLKEQGFDSVRGVGGTVTMKPLDCEVSYRVFVHTVKPYKLAMKMLNVPNGVNFTPPSWISIDVARCSVLLVDPLTIFDNLGTLFDEIVAQGEAGVFEDIIKGLRDDPRGPKVDVREEFIMNLGGRAFTTSNYSKPISPDSESIVIGVEIKEADKNKKTDELEPSEKIKKAVDKIFNNDPDMMRTEHKGYIIWHRAPVETVELPTVSGIPGLNDDPDNTDTRGGKDENQPIFPEGGITVTPKYLIASTNVDYLKKVIDRLDAKDGTIAEHVDYKATETVLKSLGVDKTPHFAQFFTKSDESLEPTYEMIRQGKMPQSKSILGRLINAILTPDNEDGTVREQEFNWNKLPEFDKVRHAFGPAALYGESIENGFFFEGFLLKKGQKNEKIIPQQTETKENKNNKK
ncbi:MAG: hypothetical protein LBP59_05595 [Planctomycetaceae bacterium]|jgi:hypothetical protein|nr:hypothetical protein [Planctomycetaceae bacterium]